MGPSRDHSRSARPWWFTPLLLAAACGSGGGPTLGSEVDTEPPQAGMVFDGPGADIDQQTDTGELTANWDGFTDNSGSIARYDWAIGTTTGGTEVGGWENVGDVKTATRTGLALTVGVTYYVAVRAYDAAGNVSEPAVSDGVTVTSGGSSGGGSGAVLASSVTQWGITWRFAEPMPVGQFCNGDWWVVGPVEIVEIEPPVQTDGAGRVLNGSMINPDTSGLHGYDSGLFAPFQDNRYKPWLNVALGVSPGTPLVVPNASSLVSTISRPGDPTVFAPNGSMSQLQTAAVLTVLAVEPPEDAFRPPYVGADKTLRFRESDLHYGNLARVAPAGTPPSFAATAPKFQRVWLEHISGWATRFMHPVDNMMDYGRDFTTEYGTGALLAQLDVPDSTKRDLVVGLTQIGIDFHRNAQTASWPGEGGHGSGRKFPILFAGAVLNDASLLAIGQTHPSAYHGPSNPNNSSRFGEDCQTFYVQQTSPGVYNWGFGGYTSTLNNTAEWGFGHTNNIGADDSSWLGNSYRRCCTANAWVGQTLCARMMGLVSAWNHPAYFDYQDRYMQTELTSWRAWNPWHETMWDAYRATY